MSLMLSTVGRTFGLQADLFLIINVWCPCVLVSLCICIFFCLRTLCFTDGANKRSHGQSSGQMSLCTGVIVYMCLCMLDALCFSDGGNGLSDSGRPAGFFLITWSGILVYCCHCVHVSLYV